MTSPLKYRFAQVGLLGVVLVMAGFAGLRAAGSVPTARPEEAGFSSEKLRAVHDTMQRHIDAGDITGAVTMVASRGHVVHIEAHG
jgi:hypothetical protein